jgi:inner membrane protein
VDSLSQMVLGAAVGEAVLGRKIGNRAILWGAIAGTIPDLDVMKGFFMSEVDSLVFHRGFTHSLLFCFLGSFFFGSFADVFFKRQWYNFPALKWLYTVFVFSGIFFPSVWMFIKNPNIQTGVFSVLLIAIAFGLGFYMYRRYVSVNDSYSLVSRLEWYQLFFWGFVTHILLDCFTTYGTQCLLPFSNYRVSWNTISVVDPLYTIPFLFFLLLTIWRKRGDKWRFRLNTLGLVISTSYLVFTIGHKIRMDHVFQDSLKLEGISYFRFHSTPTIFNNALWYGLAETNNGYYYTYYSVFDQRERSLDWTFIPKCFDADVWVPELSILKTLKWFSNGYYILNKDHSGDYIWIDLRFGNMDFFERENSSDFVFYYKIVKDNKGSWDIEQRRPPVNNPGALFSALFQRIKGV